ncbi:esterase-like activity of phytase family protein, partial [Escherichia coli]|uniref:esterase-like activity of phytase family protein n=1 Tax=Escherichia coli TaxID=562 RepID=UPI0014368A13
VGVKKPEQPQNQDELNSNKKRHTPGDDAKKNIFYAINDSRNNNKEGDASLYTLKIQVSSRGIEQVNFLNQRPLLDAKQQPFVTNT